MATSSTRRSGPRPRPDCARKMPAAASLPRPWPERRWPSGGWRRGPGTGPRRNAASQRSARTRRNRWESRDRRPRVWDVADEVQLVPFDEDSYYQDPVGFFARLRESRPVAPVRMPGRGRAWFITRDADVRAALADPRLANDVHHYPGGARQWPSEAADGVHAHLLNTDPPVHTRLRRLVGKAFTPRRVALLRPRAEEIAAG